MMDAVSKLLNNRNWRCLSSVLVPAIATLCFAAPTSALAESGERALIQQLGTCVVAGHEDQLLSWSNERIPGNEYRERSAFVYDYIRECLAKVGVQKVNLSPWNIDGIVSEGLVRSVFAKDDPGDLGAIESEDDSAEMGNAKAPSVSVDPSVRTKAYQRYLSGLRHQFVISATECFVRTNSSGVRAFLLTDAESKDEAAKMDSLKDTFATCLPNEAGFYLNISEARMWMAVSYRKLASIKAKGRSHA